MEENYMKSGMEMFIGNENRPLSIKRNKQILIIEDNSTYRRLLEMRLNSNGFDTLVAENGIDGFEAAKNEKPDLVIVDLMIPGMDGHALCRELKKDPELAHIPVVILTCRNRAEDVELARKAHVDAYILKSMMSKVLIDVLNRILNDKGGSGE